MPSKSYGLVEDREAVATADLQELVAGAERTAGSHVRRRSVARPSLDCPVLEIVE